MDILIWRWITTCECIKNLQNQENGTHYTLHVRKSYYTKQEKEKKSYLESENYITLLFQLFKSVTWSLTFWINEGSLTITSYFSFSKVGSKSSFTFFGSKHAKTTFLVHKSDKTFWQNKQKDIQSPHTSTRWFCNQRW